MKKQKNKLNRRVKQSKNRNKKATVKKDNVNINKFNRDSSLSLPNETLKLAVRALQSGKPKEAYSICLKALRTNPADTEALNLAGVAAFQNGESDQAISLLNTAISFRPDFSDAYNNLGNVQKGIGDLVAAEASYLRAVSCGPENLDAEFNLGIMLEAQGLFKRAEEAYLRCIQLCPNMVPALFNLGNILKALGRLNEAEIIYKRALDIEPENPEVLINMGAVLTELSRKTEAIHFYRKAIGFKPDFAEAHYNLGIVLQEINEQEKAVLAYKQALIFNPEHVGAVVNIGYCLKEMGSIEKAKGAYLQALKIAPDYDKSLVNLGDLLLHQGDIDEAIKVCIKFLSEHPGNISVLAFLAIAYLNSGDLDSVSKLYDFQELLKFVYLDKQFELSELKKLNQNLSDHILDHPSLVEQPSSHATRSGRHSGELLVDPMGPVARLKEIILDTVNDYCLALPPDTSHSWKLNKPEIFNISVWGVSMEKQGHQVSHIHPSAWLSGVYYPKIPDSINADDLGHSGWIEFGRPPDNFSINDEPLIKLIRPEEGLMLLFPSYFYHRTIPYNSDDTRISIAFDILAS